MMLLVLLFAGYDNSQLVAGMDNEQQSSQANPQRRNSHNRHLGNATENQPESEATPKAKNTSKKSDAPWQAPPPPPPPPAAKRQYIFKNASGIQKLSYSI